MPDAAQESARRRFGDALALYDVRGGDARPLVAAATELVVEGTHGDAVLALASKVLTPLTSPFEVDTLVTTAREALGMVRLDPEQAAVRAAQTQVRRWVRDELSDRQLTAWAHQMIGHQGPSVLDELVESDDRLDLAGVSGTTDSVHRDLVRISEQVLALADPWG